MSGLESLTGSTRCRQRLNAWVCIAALGALRLGAHSRTHSTISPDTTSYQILPIHAPKPQSTEVNESPLSEATPSTTQGSTSTARSTIAIGFEKTPSPLTDRLTSTFMSTAADGRAEISPAEIALHDAKDVMTKISLSKKWEGAVSRIKWVMDTLSPVAEVCYDLIFPIDD